LLHTEEGRAWLKPQHTCGPPKHKGPGPRDEVGSSTPRERQSGDRRETLCTGKKGGREGIPIGTERTTLPLRGCSLGGARRPLLLQPGRREKVTNPGRPAGVAHFPIPCKIRNNAAVAGTILLKIKEDPGKRKRLPWDKGYLETSIAHRTLGHAEGGMTSGPRLGTAARVRAVQRNRIRKKLPW